MADAPTPRPARPDAEGVITVILVAYQEGDPAYSITMPDGTVVRNPGYKLGELRALIGGDQGVLIDPIRGEEHAVSLAAWASADSDTTRIIVGYQRTTPGHSPSTTLPNLPHGSTPTGGSPTS